MRRDEKTPRKKKAKKTTTEPVERLAYSIEESGASVDLSRATMYRKIAAGEGPKITRVGGRRIITVEHHREWVRWLSEQSA